MFGMHPISWQLLPFRMVWVEKTFWPSITEGSIVLLWSKK
jgi:hypothetical protein